MRLLTRTFSASVILVAVAFVCIADAADPPRPHKGKAVGVFSINESGVFQAREIGTFTHFGRVEIISNGQIGLDGVLRGVADYRTADGSMVRAEFEILPIPLGSTTTTGTVRWTPGAKPRRFRHIQGSGEVIVTATGPNTVKSMHSGRISY